MKKIFIAATDMAIGGAERALLGLLNALDKEKYQIDLFLLHHSGPLMDLIPKEIRLLPEIPKYADLGIPIQKVLKHGHLDIFYGRLKGKIKAGQYAAKHQLKKDNSVSIHYSFKYTLPYLPVISDTLYDLAIGFTIPYYLVDQKVQASKKAAWIHTDYAMIDGDREEELKVWDVYNHIISISEAVTRSFVSVYPSLAKKIFLMENILSPDLIRKQADLFDIPPEFSDGAASIHLLSIGRLTKAKNFDNVPDICARLIHAGWPVKWYIIGFGSDQSLIEDRICEAQMENNVFLLGEKANPYPYIRHCDLYIQPSRYEGKSIAVREAQILHKPVVITCFPTADSQLKDGIDGLIVPMNNEDCAEGIAMLLGNPKKQLALIRHCQSEDFSTETEALKIDQLFESSSVSPTIF